MPRFTYIGGVDVVDVPLLGRLLEQGDVFDVPDDLAPRFAEQPDNYAPADDDAQEG